jgi:DNA-binding LacI/PurR family transcriptional regulator
MRKNREKRVTASDVARLAGVSSASVTRVFNPNWEYNIKPAIKEKVLKAALSLNYTPNVHARLLAANSSTKTNSIAVILGPTTGYFYANVVLQFVYKAQDQGKQVLLFTVNTSTAYKDLLNRVIQYRVDAIILTSAAYKMVYDLVKSEIPVIVFNYLGRKIKRVSISNFYGDSFQGGQFAADILLDNNHKKIAYISGNRLRDEDTERERGFVQRLREHEKTVWKTEKGIYSDYQSGFNAALRIVADRRYPDAIFCGDDALAMGAMDALRFKCNLSIPQDISIVGFNDIREASLPAYSLTTLNVPISEMVDATLRYIEDLNNPEQSCMQIFPMRPVIRNSVRLSNEKYLEEQKRTLSKVDILLKRIP